MILLCIHLNRISLLLMGGLPGSPGRRGKLKIRSPMRIVLCLLLHVLVQSVHAQTTIQDLVASTNLSLEKTSEGIYYHIEELGVGLYPKDGDYVMIRFKASLPDGRVFDESDPNEPFLFQVGNREVIKGLERAVQLLKPGGKGIFFIPSELGYGERGVGDVVPPHSPLIYELELLQIMDFQAYDDFMRKLEERERREFEYEQERIFRRDLQTIDQLIKARKLHCEKLPSGLAYCITKKGKGPNAKPGDRLKVSYEGFLADGRPIQLPAEERTYEFFLGQGSVMDGWEEGLLHFNEGAEGWLFIPSKLAYGPLSIQEEGIDIPSNAVLVFRIKVLSIRHY